MRQLVRRAARETWLRIAGYAVVALGLTLGLAALDAAQAQVGPGTNFSFSSQLTLLGRYPNGFGKEDDPVMPATGKNRATFHCGVEWDQRTVNCTVQINISYTSFVYFPQHAGTVVMIAGMPPMDPTSYGWNQQIPLIVFSGLTAPVPMTFGMDTSPTLNVPAGCAPATSCMGGALWYIAGSTGTPQNPAINCNYVLNISETSAQCLIGKGDLSSGAATINAPHIDIQTTGFVTTSLPALSSWICANPKTVLPSGRYPPNLCSAPQGTHP